MTRKQSKPNVSRKRSGGRWIYYYRKGEQYVRLPDNPDSPEFDDAYWAIRSGRAQPVVKTTFAALVEDYKGSKYFKRLAPSTRASYSRYIDALNQINGEKDVRKFTRAGIEAIHKKHAATPRKADWYVQILSTLMKHAIRLEWRTDNPAATVDLYGKQREYEPWPAWMVERLSEAPQSVRTAAELMLGTGQRPNAAFDMTWDRFDGEWMVVLDEKQGATFEAYCPADLRAYLDQLPQTGRHVLAKNLTEPLGYDAVERAFRKWRSSLGDRAKKFTLHGLRKLAIIRLAEAGCSDAEIQAVTGQSAETVAYYRARASRRRLSRAAQEKRK